jgi:16S rRNA (guanine527-N7)-methyltransferase
VSVSRETVAAVTRRFGIADPEQATEAIARLLDALQAEPAPPTTVTEPAEALDVHIADSLVALEVPELSGAKRIADVGAGAGFPGLPLAAALPGASVDLIEATRRKCAVIDRLALAAGISGSVRAIPARVEDWAAGEGRGAYDAVTARAVAPLAVLCEYAAPLLRNGGVLVAWKGARDFAEDAAGDRAAAELGLSSARVAAVTPYLGSNNRHLHVYSKLRQTPSRFPRRAGVATKRPTS